MKNKIKDSLDNYAKAEIIAVLNLTFSHDPELENLLLSMLQMQRCVGIGGMMALNALCIAELEEGLDDEDDE